MFLPLHLLTRIEFELDASCLFINASCLIGLGLEVEAFRKAIIWEISPLGSRVRVGQ